VRQASLASDESRKDAGRDPERNLYPAALLFAITVLAQMVSLAFGRLDSEQSFSRILLPSLLFVSVMTIPAC